ncbi:hypothetical protein NLX83_13885 [Allokutzneria sp. A3M-2-11 16]|uniref:hypothetical protein n=1 Tax=Allokutzneria sp. A3M-2-11 16 TaxID=2962043 RepID=UPI0020B7295F|nr:hypothetical protein [Allokutzneria sp. A3M-2-11 16]MCP3800350.1 hypothetical protein [Allokutzneria sp. A3M-2-11 16]
MRVDLGKALPSTEQDRAHIQGWVSIAGLQHTVVVTGLLYEIVLMDTSAEYGLVRGLHLRNRSGELQMTLAEQLVPRAAIRPEDSNQPIPWLLYRPICTQHFNGNP